MKILLVGNSKDVLYNEWGSAIDQFDNVCRFNNFQTKNFEKYVGTKTDLLAFRACDDVKLVKPEELQMAWFFVTYCNLTNGMRQVAQHQKFFYGDKGTIVDDKACYRYAEEIGLSNDGVERPSIGALAIAHFKSFYDNVQLYTYGFTGSVNGKSTHYFPRQPKDSCYHNWEKEDLFLEKCGVIQFCP